MKNLFTFLIIFCFSLNLFGQNDWVFSGYKIIDTNCNGIFDGQDYYMPNWKFYLLDASSNVLDSTTTNSNGYFEFGVDVDFNNFPGQPNYYLLEEMQSFFTPYSNTLVFIDSDSLFDVGSDGFVWFFFNCPVDTVCPDSCIAPNGLNVSTGYDNDNNALMNDGENDPAWVITMSPNLGVTLGAATVIDANGASWDCNGINNPNNDDPTPGNSACNAMWLSPYPTHANTTTNLNNPDANGGIGNADNPYQFKNCFCLCMADSITLDLQVSADNYAELYLEDDATNTNILNIGSLTLATMNGGSIWNQGTMNSNFYNTTVMNHTIFLEEGVYCIVANVYDEGTSLGLKIEGAVNSNSGVAVENTMCCNPKIFVSGTKFVDNDCDGVFTSGVDEVGSGWTIHLYDNNNNLIATTTTDVYGYYSFELDQSVYSGDFVVVEETQADFSPFLSDQFLIEDLGLDGPDGAVVNFFNCPADTTEVDYGGCVALIADSTYCVNGNNYETEIILENITDFDFVQYVLTPINQGAITSPSYFNDYWASGDYKTLNININDFNENEDSLCFFMSGFSLINDTMHECCIDTICIAIPEPCVSSITDPNKGNKKLIKITDLLGQEIPIRKNTPMFYIYDDGSVEKKIIME